VQRKFTDKLRDLSKQELRYAYSSKALFAMTIFGYTILPFRITRFILNERTKNQGIDVKSQTFLESDGDIKIYVLGVPSSAYLKILVPRSFK